MAVAIRTIEIRGADLQVIEPMIEEPKEEPVDEVAAVKFVEAITGRKIREQISIDYAKIQSGRIKNVHGNPVDPYINQINDVFRDHDFDVVAGADYTKVGKRVHRAVRLLIRPGLSELDRVMLGGAISSIVPKEVKVVYKETDYLKLRPAEPWIRHRGRMTASSERFRPERAIKG